MNFIFFIKFYCTKIMIFFYIYRIICAMKYICRFILFICMFFISLSANAFCDISNNVISKHADSISAVNYNDTDILYSRNNGSITQNIERNDSLLINNKTSDNSSDNGFTKYLHASITQFEYLLSYIYTQSYLRNKTKVSFHSELSEIQPNAP